METVREIANMVAFHWVSLYQAFLFPLLILDVKEALRVAGVIQNLHVDDRCGRRQLSINMESGNMCYDRGWGGLLVARLHYLTPYFLYILADLASIAAPNTNFFMVFQVATVVSGKSKPNLLSQVVRASLVLGTLIKELLGTAASSEKK